MQFEHNFCQILRIFLHILVILIPVGTEALIDAYHHCFLLLSHQLNDLFIYFG